MTAWWDLRLCGFDLETDSPQPEVAHIVSAAVVLAGGGIEPERLTLLSDVDGHEIPEEAAAIHGVTTERARAEGQPAREVLTAIRCTLAVAIAAGYPLCIMNSRFDATVLDRELRRHGLDPLPAALVIDPSVIDKQLDRYRRSYPPGVTKEQAAEQGIPSSRTLAGMCSHYRATLDEAHDAASDALAAARLAWVLGARGEVVRRVRNAQDGREKAALVREWESVRGDLRLLHSAQERWALAERDRFAEYKRSIGEHDEAARIDAERGWPVLEVMAHEESAAADRQAA